MIGIKISDLEWSWSTFRPLTRVISAVAELLVIYGTLSAVKSSTLENTQVDDD